MDHAPNHVADPLFDSGLFEKSREYLDLLGRPRTRILTKMVLTLLIGWAPLPILVLTQMMARRDPGMLSFFSDFGVHARSLLAAPLLVLAEAVCLPRLAVVVEHFISGGFVRGPNRAGFDKALASTRKLAASKVVIFLAVTLAYLVVVGLLRYVPPGFYPLWYSPSHHGYPDLTWASWWYALISLPLLLVIIFIWGWRILCWVRFTFLVSRLKLFLIPAHPDQVGGLSFLDLTLFAFMPLGFVLGLFFAGPIANRVVHEHSSLMSFRFPILILVCLVLVIFVVPLSMFVVNLRNEYRRGVLQYGALAHNLGEQFERKWFRHPVTPETLEAPDFSATTDLYSIVAYSQGMRLLPFDLRSVIYLLVVSLLPFVPVILMTIPLSVIVDGVARLLV